MTVDAHIHYFDSPGFVDGLLNDMDEAGIDKAVLLPTIGDSTWEYVGLTFKKVDNEAMLGALKAHPDRFVGGIRVIPTQEGAHDEFMRFAETGYFRLLKLSPPEGFTVDDERIYPIYDQCAKLNFPVLIHMGQTGGEFIGEKKKKMYQLNSSLANPITLDSAAKAFPELNFIIAHNGYPYKIEAWAVADGNENIYLDIAGSGPWVDGTVNIYTAMGREAFIPIDLNKVIWGSDNCLAPKESLSRADAYMRIMGANKTQRKLIFGGNAERLFNL